MSEAQPLRCYDYVNQPYAHVRAALQADAARVFHLATTSASEREHNIGVQLRVRVGALELAAEVQVQVGPPEDLISSPQAYQVTAFPLSWRASSSPSLFPLMRAKLFLYPLSATETQLEFEGTYEPPLGLLGDAIDAMVGKRIAEATVLRFVQDIAAQLSTPEPGALPAAPQVG